LEALLSNMHQALQTGLGVVSILTALYWLFVARGVLRLRRDIPLLEEQTPSEPKTWPRVSVIVPACNEADTIEEAMRSRLAEGYPNAEYIVVDDRSTDATGDIIDRLAQADDRVVPIHIAELPPGWLGKVHAMHVGLARATGDFILFSDADVHHEPGALARIVALSEERSVDHVALFPSVWPTKTFWHDAVMSCLLRMFAVMSRAWKASDPKSRAAVGGGNFNLVRRSALERAGGIEQLKLEVIDDAALGQLLKWSGARQLILNARGSVGLWFYRSVRETIRGMEKNAFAAVGGFNVGKHVVVLALLLTMELGVFGSLAFGPGWARVLSTCALGVAIAAHVGIARWLGRPIIPALFAPAGTIVFAFAAMRSMLLAVMHDGVEWRGTRYPLAAQRRRKEARVPMMHAACPSVV
jgi:hypothetical protein